MKFQLDTGAECNVVPLSLYKKATGDVKLKNVMSTDDEIVAFHGSKLKLTGQVFLTVSQGNTKCTLHCNLADVNVHPLLGQKACIDLQLIRVLDSDDVNQPNTDGHPVFAIERGDQALSKQQLVKKFPKVFTDNVRKLEGQYHIKRGQFWIQYSMHRDACKWHCEESFVSH